MTAPGADPWIANAIVIGAGPAGLMAAETLVQSGHSVEVFDAMPSAGRKFLLAGIGGLNLTHSEPYGEFVQRYRDRQAALTPMLDRFGADALRAWAKGLGVDTFVGSSGRVFPAEMKAAPLLRAWLHRLRQSGVRFQMRSRWGGWNERGELVFESSALHHPAKFHRPAPKALVLALGGASWPKLGSDGAWLPLLRMRGVEVADLKPANCGFEIEWSEYFARNFAGHPLKPVSMSLKPEIGPVWSRQGELVVTSYGIEGSLVYAVSASLREEIASRGAVTITLDLAPHRTVQALAGALSQPRGKRSTASHWRSRAGLAGVAANLVRELASLEVIADPRRLAEFIKQVPIRLRAPRPIAEAISTAGGVRFESLDDGLMLKSLPGVFCAGEMLDWEAPTGGYLLSGCFATGRAAGLAAARWLAHKGG